MNAFLKYIACLGIPVMLMSCGGEGEHPLKEAYFYLQESNKEWLPADTLPSTFLMEDAQGIQSSFAMESHLEEMGKSWTTVLGINTVTTYTEEHFLSYRSTYGLNLDISMRANTSPHGDDLRVSLGGVAFTYDFDFQQVHHLDTPFGYKWLLTTDRGYEVAEDGEILSHVEFLDTLTTEFGLYSEVLHFSFDDFKEQWDTFTVTEIWLARHVGLVKYKRAGGVSAERVH